MKTTLVLPAEMKSLDKVPAPFYTFDSFNNYIFIHTDNYVEATLYAQQNYLDLPIRYSKLGHKSNDS